MKRTFTFRQTLAIALLGSCCGLPTAGSAEPVGEGVQAGDASAESLVFYRSPVLGAVTDRAAAVWVQTNRPGTVRVSLQAVGSQAVETQVHEAQTEPAGDPMAIVRFDGLEPGTRYEYAAVPVGGVEVAPSVGAFKTDDPAAADRPLRLAYGSCFKPAHSRTPPGTSAFLGMAEREPDVVFFLGDFPYTKDGGADQLRAGHATIRGTPGFDALTASTPTLAVYDDHDFGPNDSDGTHPNADVALETFKRYWPNPGYGLPDAPGIFCTFTRGPVEFFLLDGRYPSRQGRGTMLGAAQNAWLRERLVASTARFKVLVSGTPFSREKEDAWAGTNYIQERDELFGFIAEHGISGVVAISGDIHRSDVHRLPLGGERYLYDFTTGPLAHKPRVPPYPLPPAMIHSYGRLDDRDTYTEIDFNPGARDAAPAITYRTFSTRFGKTGEVTVSASDLFPDE